MLSLLGGQGVEYKVQLFSWVFWLLVFCLLVFSLLDSAFSLQGLSFLTLNQEVRVGLPSAPGVGSNWLKPLAA